jgi:hypothetical protein
MTPGFTTWDALDRIDGAVLLIVDSPIDRGSYVAAVIDEFEARARGGFYVVAPSSWREWLSRSKVPAANIRFAVDSQGRDLELIYFLETPEAIKWVCDRRFALVAGAEPHSLYNDEVKALLEQRVALLIGDGYLLTHALPERGVYLFDLAGLIERFGREPKRDAYLAWSRALVEDLHALWVQRGRPEAVDDPDRSQVIERLAAHLGRPTFDYDETGPIPFRRDEGPAEPTAGFVGHLRDVIRDRDSRLLQLEADRDRILAERNEAVDARDRTIEDLRKELGAPLSRLRRRLSGR